jgi:peptidoglycan/LPS O-acetylase OafA/YrhL
VTRDLSHSLAQSGPQGRGGALDALRFAAALLIVLYHYGSEAPIPLAGPASGVRPGVPCHRLLPHPLRLCPGPRLWRQILSGRIGLLAFLRKRVARIWPGQLMVLAALATVVTLATLAGATERHPGNYTPVSLLMQALLVQAWGLSGGGGWNHQSWSLSALVVCYAAFPVAWRWISRMTSPLALLALGLTAVMAGDLICLRAFHHSIYDLDFSLGVIRAAPLFLLGICIARVVEQGRPGVGRARILAWLAMLAFVVLQVEGRFDLLSIIAIAIAVIVLALGRLPVDRPSRLIEQGAKLSFALFITHALTGLVWFGGLNALHGILPANPWLHYALWSLSLPLALGVAGLFHRFVDGPGAGLAGRPPDARPRVDGSLVPRLEIARRRRVADRTAPRRSRAPPGPAADRRWRSPRPTSARRSGRRSCRVEPVGAVSAASGSRPISVTVSTAASP